MPRKSLSPVPTEQRVAFSISLTPEAAEIVRATTELYNGSQRDAIDALILSAEGLAPALPQQTLQDLENAYLALNRMKVAKDALMDSVREKFDEHMREADRLVDDTRNLFNDIKEFKELIKKRELNKLSTDLEQTVDRAIGRIESLEQTLDGAVAVKAAIETARKAERVAIKRESKDASA
jgi:predicted nuclease with TOPRIM domain